MIYLVALSAFSTTVCALCLCALAPAVIRDTHRAPEYRSNMLKLTGGVFARSGRNPVLARRRRKDERASNQDAEQGDAGELLHALSVGEGADR